ncbi:perilipin-1 isoform X1 [Lepisosteus oculatus]|uniref:perilipin-1 isoform X1 n=1 Tax=Lepisosteus oculatus TaxID=7918 RepID=UPI0037185015
MATEKTVPAPPESTEESVLARLLALPVVDGTFAVIERAYSSTKHVHPVVCSVCEVYETGAKVATSLAVLSIQPAIHRLEPQIVAVNKLACKGLDRLEENIPALQYPPDKLASSIAEVISSTVTVAKDSITSPIARTSDRVLSVALDSYQLTRSALGDTVDYLLSSRPAQLAAEGVDVFISVTENLVDYILPPAQDEKDKDVLQSQGADVYPPGQQPGSYRRLEALASTVWRRAYDQTATQLQRTKSQGQELVMWVPGVAPLTSLAKKNLEFAGGVLLAVPSSVSGLLFGGTEEQKDKEKKKKKEGELLQSDEVQGLVSSLGHQLQNAYTSVVSSVRSAPEVTVALAKDTAGALIETWSSVLKNVSHYIPLSGVAGKEDARPSRVSGDSGAEPAQGEDQPKSIPPASGSPQTPAAPGRGEGAQRPSDTVAAQLLQQKVLEQIPVQQRILLGGPGTRYSSHSESRRGESAPKSPSPTYPRTVHTSTHPTTKKD